MRGAWMRGARVMFTALAILVGSTGSVAAAETTNPGDEYVRLALALDTATDGGYIFAYYGPEEKRQEVAAAGLSIDAISRDAHSLIAEIDATEASGIEAERLAALRLRVSAMLARIDVLKGRSRSFADEAVQIFGVHPPRYSTAEADAALGEVDRMLPGAGSLAERAAAFKERMKVPQERQEAVFRAAIEACRERTAEHIDMPQGEAVELELVDRLPAAGRYDYLGDYRGRVTVKKPNASISNALYLGCHEAYPGHHLRAILMEERYGARDWPELDVSTLFEPASLLDEGLGQYAVDLAFPDEEKVRFFREELLPLAGLDPNEAERLVAFNSAMEAALPYGTIEVSRAYLDREITRDEAVDLLAKYGLRPREEMSGMFGFVDSFRTFVVTYSLGEELVRERIEAAGDDPKARWTAFRDLSAALVTPALMGLEPEEKSRPTAP